MADDVVTWLVADDVVTWLRGYVADNVVTWVMTLRSTDFTALILTGIFIALQVSYAHYKCTCDLS